MLRISIALNVLLLILLAGVLFLWMRREVQVLYYAQARPQGALLTIPADTAVYPSGSDCPAFTLPKGTILQESTPHGLATLGKTHDREYLLLIRSPGFDFPTNRAVEAQPCWTIPYSLKKNDAGEVSAMWKI